MMAGRGIGDKGLLEPFLRLEAVGRVLEDQHQAIGHALLVVDDEAADPVDPLRLGPARTRDLDDDVVEALAADHALDRVATVLDAMVVAILKLEVAPVLVDGRAEGLDRIDPVHGERGIVGPGDRSDRAR